MKGYVQITLNKLNKFVEEHPDADLKFLSGSTSSMCGCKVISSDIRYEEANNTIYIG